MRFRKLSVTVTFHSSPDASATSASRSEEHTSELQSQSNLVCRLLLEKKKTNYNTRMYNVKEMSTEIGILDATNPQVQLSQPVFQIFKYDGLHRLAPRMRLVLVDYTLH